MLKNSGCEAYTLNKNDFKRPLSPPPIGSCVRPIVYNYLKLIQKNTKVLEIGCGSWSLIREHCRQIGAHYEGIDIDREYFGIPVVATRIENLAHLSYTDNEFDLVIGNQSMEHWAENGCTNSWGLYQCFRVCRDGGTVALNVPIHFHGTKLFLHGRLEKIRRLFAPYASKVVFEKWGTPSTPIEPIHYYPRFEPLKNSPAYHLDIRCVKDRPTKRPLTRNWFGLTGRSARIFNYSFSFNLYRLRRKFFK